MTETLPAAIIREIDRVTNLVEVYRYQDRLTGGRNCVFAIWLMQHSIADAKKACGDGDAVAMVRVLADLRGFHV